MKKFINDKGYVVYATKRKIIKRSRYIMQNMYGKKSIKGKEIHHIDNVSDNDEISNLLPVGKAEHKLLHKLINDGDIEKYQKRIDEIYEKWMMEVI